MSSYFKWQEPQYLKYIIILYQSARSLRSEHNLNGWLYIFRCCAWSVEHTPSSPWEIQKRCTNVRLYDFSIVIACFIPVTEQYWLDIRRYVDWFGKITGVGSWVCSNQISGGILGISKHDTGKHFSCTDLYMYNRPNFLCMLASFSSHTELVPLPVFISTGPKGQFVRFWRFGWWIQLNFFWMFVFNKRVQVCSRHHFGISVSPQDTHLWFFVFIYS